PARGRKPVLRDELAAVVVKQQYPPERLRWSAPRRFRLRSPLQKSSCRFSSRLNKRKRPN
ncbi:MAG: hypothetical protein JXA30_04915, partial [Deltaproteobacteria bacterium]|nr:hypothetical protein [Deltaproteobacteria bacterium]